MKRNHPTTGKLLPFTFTMADLCDLLSIEKPTDQSGSLKPAPAGLNVFASLCSPVAAFVHVTPELQVERLKRFRSENWKLNCCHIRYTEVILDGSMLLMLRSVKNVKDLWVLSLFDRAGNEYEIYKGSRRSARLRLPVVSGFFSRPVGAFSWVQLQWIARTIDERVKGEVLEFARRVSA
jgi:hypothetical protein